MEQGRDAVGLVLQDGQGERKDRAEGHAAEGDAIGQDEVVEVDERGHDQGGGKDEIDRGEDRPTVDDPEQGEQGAGEEFDEEIARGDGRAAVTAFTVEDEPGEQRNVVPRRDPVIAGGAMGAGKHDGFLARDAPDADVEETADAETGEENEGGKRPGGFRRERHQRFRAFSAFSRAARMTATGGLRPVQRRKARAPWWSSMPRPLAVRAPAARAAARNGVSAGL